MITIVVDRGFINSVFTSIQGDINVKIIDFDVAREDPDNPNALNEAVSQLKAIQFEQRIIYSLGEC